MTSSEGLLAEVRYLKSAAAVREQSHALLALARRDELEHFQLNEARLPEVAAHVLSVTRAAYPDVRRIPYHSRFRHFAAGRVDRAAELERALASESDSERLMARTELVILSVLLDAGAGPIWTYLAQDGKRYSRSEGLAVASIEWFQRGGFSESSRPRADAVVLERLDEAALARAFQVSEGNPLVGLEGRAALLRQLGRAVREQPQYFGAAGRLGGLGVYLAERARDGRLPADDVLTVVLDALGPIWPGREVIGGVNLGDVWAHPAVGRVPFHKLSQWLSYSLCEALERASLTVTELGALTGLAEYRNGGLFLDGGVLALRDARDCERVHDVGSPLIVEWRALTVALLDVTASLMRSELGLSEVELPLARVLEGGTWAAGRALAFARRADGAPPLSVASDGTVF